MKIRPLRHHLILETQEILPDSPFFPGYNPPPKHLHPLEMPHFIRKRLIDFLEQRFPIPPDFLQTLIPISEVPHIRRTYQDMRSGGMTRGEAILSLGLVQRQSYTSPSYRTGQVLAVACPLDCSNYLSEGSYAIISATAGACISDNLFSIYCQEIIIKTTPETAQEAKARAEQAARQQRLVLTKLRLCHSA